MVGVVVKDDLTQLSRKTGGRERKESTPDRHVKRCLNRNRAGPKPHCSPLGAVEAKAVLQLKAYQSRVCVRTRFTELLKKAT